MCELSLKNFYPNVRLTLKRYEQIDVFIRVKISFVVVDHLMRGGRGRLGFCSWELYGCCEGIATTELFERTQTMHKRAIISKFRGYPDRRTVVDVFLRNLNHYRNEICN